jgi:hypothetical protein
MNFDLDNLDFNTGKEPGMSFEEAIRHYCKEYPDVIVKVFNNLKEEFKNEYKVELNTIKILRHMVETNSNAAALEVIDGIIKRLGENKSLNMRTGAYENKKVD